MTLVCNQSLGTGKEQLTTTGDSLVTLLYVSAIGRGQTHCLAQPSSRPSCHCTVLSNITTLFIQVYYSNRPPISSIKFRLLEHEPEVSS